MIYSMQNPSMVTKQLFFIFFCSCTLLLTFCLWYSERTYVVYTFAYLLPAAYAQVIFLQVQNG